MNPVTDCQAYLEELGLVGGSSGWSITRRRVHDEGEDQLVTLTEDGGPPPELYALEGLGDEGQASLGLQVRARGEPWDGDAPAAKLAEVFAALHAKAKVTIGDGVYLLVAAVTAAPAFLGYDERGRPEFTQSYRFTVRLQDHVAAFLST